NLGVSGPADPLITLRAVAGHRKEISAHRPHDVLVQPVEKGSRRIEPGSATHVCVNHDGDDSAGIKLSGPARDLGETEAVERADRPHTAVRNPLRRSDG